MIPDDLYQYCIKHGLLDSILSGDDTSDSMASGRGASPIMHRATTETNVSHDDDMRVF
jgi:hypothetical protein